MRDARTAVDAYAEAWALNYFLFKNADYDKLIDQAGQTDNADERNALLRKADTILYDEAPAWFFNYNKAVMAYQPWLKGSPYAKCTGG